jgi:hypothetical protein
MGRRLGRSVNEIELCRRLREAGAIDLSQSALDARAACLFKLLQFELGVTFLDHLAEAWRTRGRPRQAAERLFAKHHVGLTADNMEAKDVMLRDLAEQFGVLAASRTEPNAIRLFQALRGRIQDILYNVGSFRRVYTDIYQGLGYEVPSWVSAPEEAQGAPETQPDPVVIAAVAEVVLAPEVQVDTPDPEVVSGLREQADDLAKKAHELGRPWTMNDRARKAEGWEDAAQALMQLEGCRDKFGEIFARMERREAQELVAVLRYLGQLGGRANLARAREVLSDAIRNQSDLAAQVELLAGEARRTAPGVVIDLPHLVPLGEYVQAIRADWARYDRALRVIWPDNAGGVSDAIKRLLLPSISSDPVV